MRITRYCSSLSIFLFILSTPPAYLLLAAGKRLKRAMFGGVSAVPEGVFVKEEERRGQFVIP